MATQDYLQPKKQKERRTRKTHAKVKTGCLTCKFRRKKCDETRPYCLRCTKLGLTCEGYAQVPHKSSTGSPGASSSFLSHLSNFSLQSDPVAGSLADSHEAAALHSTDKFGDLPICRSPSSLSFSNDTDRHCFDFFRYNTGPQFESFFDSSMWRSVAIKTAILHPVVLRAVTAVGAVHQRFNHGISREAFEYCAIADRLYQEAVKSFVDYQKSDRTASGFNENSMMVSLLFALFEAFQGNFVKSVQHTVLGLRSMWNRPFIVAHSESRYRRHEVTPDLLTKLFRRLYNRASQLFGSPPQVTKHKTGESPPPVPNRFWTLKEARDSIFTEAEWILHAPTEFWHDESKRQEAQRRHVSRVFDWSVAYAEMVKDQDDRTAKQKQAGLFLKTVRDATYLLLYVITFASPESESESESASTTPARAAAAAATATNDSPVDSEDTDTSDSPDTPTDLFTTSDLLNTMLCNRADLSTRFTRLYILIESQIDETSPYNYVSHSYSCDTALGFDPNPRPTITPESSGKMRHVLTRLARPHSSVEHTDVGVWKVISVYKLAEWLASVEEHAVMAAAQDLIPKHLDPQWVDITAFIEERKVLLRYCRPDGLGDFGQGLIWVQEWMTF